MPSHQEIARSVAEDIYGKGNLGLIDEYFSPDYLAHEPLGVLDRDDVRDQVQQFRAAFPDMKPVVEEQIEQGDIVVTRFSVEGTHKGTFMGIAPTHRPCRLTGITVSHFRQAKIAEDWTNWDVLGLLSQIGGVKLPEQVERAVAAATPAPEARV